MFNFKTFPLSQKILLGFTISGGILLIICSFLNILNSDMLNLMIFFYSFTPLFVLVTDTIIYLNEKRIFNAWLILSIVIFIFYLIAYKNDKFLVSRSADFKLTTINSYLNEYSTSSLKSFLVFIIIYKLLDMIMNKKGLFIINTFRLGNWYHEGARRRVSKMDVFFNVLLFLAIFISILF